MLRFSKWAAEGLGVAPAVLEEHEPGARADAVLVVGEVLRRRGGIEGFRADEHEIVGPAGRLVQRAAAAKRLRLRMDTAEDAGSEQTLALEGGHRLGRATISTRLPGRIRQLAMPSPTAPPP